MRIWFTLIMTALSALFVTSCGDEDVPGIEKAAVSESSLQGGWGIHSTNAIIDAENSFYSMILNSYRDELDNKLKEKSARTNLYFADGVVFKVRVDSDDVPPYVRQCNYTLDDYILHLEDEEFLGYYAPYLYVKIENDELVLYLQRDETLDLLEKDGSIDGYMSTVRKAVDDAQCQLRFKRNDIPFYREIEASLSEKNIAE